VEIYFSVVQRKVVSPNDFHTLDEVEARLLDFQQYYEQIATPFEWKFTKDDLNALLKRIADHENTHTRCLTGHEYVTEIPCQTT
jgi:penicillin-binding protein-related factor A (putative recombinase)